MKTIIDLETLKTEGLQSREWLSPAVVRDYADLMREGRELPPLSVVRNASGELFLTDGYHRLEALRRLRRAQAEADVVPGERIDAVRAALRANCAHGLRRSGVDKRRALTMAWDHRLELFGGDPSIAVMADACGVSERTVSRWRRHRAGSDNVMPCVHVGRDGKAYRPPVPGRQPPAAATDRFGTPVPERLAGAFDAPRYVALGQALRRLRKELTAALEAGDYGFCRVSQATTIAFDNLLSDLRLDMPYCVCPQCQGRGCRACGNIGVQTKREYEMNPVELKRGEGVKG